MNTAPDQHFLDLAINCAYITLKNFPNHSEFIYLLLSAVDEGSYE
jgi:hypothetical protein